MKMNKKNIKQLHPSKIVDIIHHIDINDDDEIAKVVQDIPSTIIGDVLVELPEYYLKKNPQYCR